MVLMLPLLSGGLDVDMHSMAFAAGKGVATICGILLFGKFVLPLEAILGMYKAINPNVDGLFQAIATFNVPFTFVKELLTAAIAFVIYKPLSPILHGRK